MYVDAYWGWERKKNRRRKGEKSGYLSSRESGVIRLKIYAFQLFTIYLTYKANQKSNRTHVMEEVN